MLPIDQRAMSPEIIEKVTQTGVVAVLVIDELKHAVPLAKALLAGGVDTIELTLRTPAALESAKAIINEVPEVTVGIGTVLTAGQVEAAAEIGASFAVAPGYNPTVISAARQCGLSFAPGIVTPSDIELAVEQGCRILKFFPAEPSGGLKYLSSMAAPYLHLDLKFIPLGGLNISNAADYISSPLIAAIGGSWIANRKQILAEDWDTITANSKEIRKLIQESRAKS